MFEQMFLPWLLFLSGLYMIFVLGWLDTRGGSTLAVFLWKVVPTLLLLALALAWVMEMGFVLAPPQ